MFITLLTVGLNDNERDLITEIYYEYRDLMKTVALKYFRDENTANDIVQDSFFKIRDKLTKISSLPRNAKRSYIVNIVKNLCIDQIRKYNTEQKHSTSLEKSAFELKSNDISVDEFLIREERRLSISERMSELSEQDSFILKAKYYHEYTTAEICEILCIESESTVRSMIHRARKRMVRILKENENYYERWQDK